MLFLPNFHSQLFLILSNKVNIVEVLSNFLYMWSCHLFIYYKSLADNI